LWHASLGVHTTGFVPVHTPDWQESVWVHPFPSVHAVPFGALGFEQKPVSGLHVPATWHVSSALHTTGVVPWHTPD
jgi:hypothetical protein